MDGGGKFSPHNEGGSDLDSTKFQYPIEPINEGVGEAKMTRLQMKGLPRAIVR